MNCPIINVPKTQGGTLYTFSSVNTDINKTLIENPDVKFKFSKFVALNIPDFYNQNRGSSTKNNVYFKDLVDKNTSESSYDRTALNRLFRNYIQDYMFNMETIILNTSSYYTKNGQSYAESIFFKWLQSVGAIDLVQDGDDETSYIESSTNRVINYIGDIDIANSVDINGETYSEIYLHIPSNHGQIAKDDIKFAKDGSRVVSQLSGSSEFIVGKTSSPGTTDTKAIYDDSSDNTYSEYVPMGIVFTDEDGDIDFNELASNSTDKFEFNSVLVYYDMVDNDDNLVSRNLYGILVLEELTDASTTETSGVSAYIQRYPKFVENGTNNGNSFGLKINIKLDVNPNSNMGTETVVSPNATHSMELFSDAMTQLTKSSQLFMSVQSELNSLQSKVEQLSNVVSQSPDWSAMKQQIITLNDLYTSLSARVTALENK